MSALRIERVKNSRDFAFVCYLRTIVYVLEQSCPLLEEFDDREDSATHYLGYIGDQPVASCRILYDGNTAKIGRIVTLKEHRGQGHASALIRHAISEIKTRPSIEKIKMSAQEHAINLYAKLGFEAYGEGYEEAGIPHRMMVMPLE